ncbi:zf-TFIIB domain-containing protein [Marisediminicola sp. UYEF4]|uniref:TFIIB-type zinc ribbon-containing protein n=1 Tax=Marisediminicola sp. UYEF4 TaxID=1756384 RepID=UPI003390E3FA
MKCPTDDALLVMSDRSGIEIDYCPQCRGVWLDRGELDKIIERSIAPVQQAAAPAPQTGYPTNDDWSRGRKGDGLSQSHGGHSDGRKRKKESWLSELFD